MIPEPTPVSGIWPPAASVLTPSTMIRTTAGLTFAAAVTTAEESSTAPGARLDVTTGACCAPLPARCRAPVLSRTTTVPPAASTAERRAAPTIGPTPAKPLRRSTATGCVGRAGGASEAANVGFTGLVSVAGPAAYVLPTGGPEAGSSHAGRAQSGRCSGVGEY